MERIAFSKIAVFTLTTGALVLCQSALAHTRLQTSTVVEGTRVYNNAVIGHGCTIEGSSQHAKVIANSIVFPDGRDSTITINGQPAPGVTDDYIAWGGKISHIRSRDVFENSGAKWAGNGAGVVGSHSWKGSLPGDGNIGMVPLRIDGAFINPTSCAQSVTFRVAIADICKVTKPAGMNETTVNLWTPAVGSRFDGPQGTHAYNSPATFKITRDLQAHPLPASCGGIGTDVVISPSAAQLNRNMPIPGLWPATK